MNKIVACLLGSLWLIWVPDCAAAQPEAWRGTVTYITDGDTLWIRHLHGGRARKIRLDGIDAPEICQAYGARARATGCFRARAPGERHDARTR